MATEKTRFPILTNKNNLPILKTPQIDNIFVLSKAYSEYLIARETYGATVSWWFIVELEPDD